MIIGEQIYLRSSIPEGRRRCCCCREGRVSPALCRKIVRKLTESLSLLLLAKLDRPLEGAAKPNFHLPEVVHFSSLLPISPSRSSGDQACYNCEERVFNMQHRVCPWSWRLPVRHMDGRQVEENMDFGPGLSSFLERLLKSLSIWLQCKRL